MNQFSIRQQIFVATLLPIIALGIVTIGVAAYAIQKVTLDLVLGRNAASVQIAAASVAGDLDNYRHLLEATAVDLAETPKSTDLQQTLCRLAPYLTPFQGGVTFLNREGVAVANTPGQEARTGLNYSFRDYFQQLAATGQPVYSTVLQEVPSGRSAVVIAVPVEIDGQFGGALGGVFFLEQQPWTDTFSLLQTPQGAQTFLFDDQGNIIYFSDAGRIGQPVPEQDILNQLIAAGKPTSILHTSRETGRRTVTAYAPIPGTSWGLATNEPWINLLSPALPYLLAVVVLVVVVIGLAALFILRNIDRVTRPLAALATETSRVSLGEPFRPLKVVGPREVRTFIRATNRMVTRLAQQQARLRDYAIQILRSQEEERKRLSRDLHDETVQELVGLVQRLELCQNDLNKDPSVAAQRLKELNNIASHTLAAVRRMSNDLRPFILEDLGLPSAVQALSDQLADLMPAAIVHCEIVGHERYLPPEVELTAFRIAQEAMTNVRKHAADASKINVTLYFEDWGILLTVEDNGPGFKVPDLQTLMRQEHLGLAGMAERAQLFGGRLSIESVLGEGTTITLYLKATSQSSSLNSSK